MTIEIKETVIHMDGDCFPIIFRIGEWIIYKAEGTNYPIKYWILHPNCDGAGSGNKKSDKCPTCYFEIPNNILTTVRILNS
jgi:hypothetical protein